MAEGEIGPAEVRAKRDLLEKAAASDSPLESLKDALSDGHITIEEFNKLRTMVPEQGTKAPPSEPTTEPLPGPTPESIESKEEAEKAEKAEVDMRDKERKRVLEIDSRIDSIKRELHDRVLRWSVVQELHKEKNNLLKEKEELLAKLPQREEAGVEEKPLTVRDEVGEINKALNQKYNKLHQEVSVIDRRPLEEEIDRLEKEKKNLEKGERGATLWSWLKERGKSMMEIPVRGELKQAEALRFGTKYAAGLAETYGTLIEKEDVEEISGNIQETNEKNGIVLSEQELKEALDSAVEKRIKANDEQVERNVAYVTDVLRERMVKTRGQATAEKVLTPDKIEKIQNELRKRMNGLRSEQVTLDTKDFTKLLRNNLDRYWWLRYGYALTEALLARKIISFVAGKVFGAKIIPIESPGFIEGGVSPISPDQLSQLYMDPGENPWAMSKEIAARTGLENPTSQQLQAIDQAFVKQNGISVEKWGISGNKPDTSLPSGWYMVSDAVKQATEFLSK